MKRTPLGVLSILPLLVVVGCKSAGARQELPPAHGEGAPPAVTVPVLSSATAGEVNAQADQLLVTGTARAVREAVLGPKSNGVVAAMLVEEGQKVKRGQTMFRLESASQALMIAQAEAGLANATVAFDNANTELQRTKALVDRGSIAPALYDQAKSRYDATKAGVDQAKAAVASARRLAADTSVQTPIDGVVAQRLANVGEMVTMMPPTRVVIIQDISQIEVRARVPETALSRIRPGSPIQVRFPSVKFETRIPIERINPSVDPITRTIEVVALVPNTEGLLKAGMLVEVDFRTSDSGNPAGAVSGSTASGSAVPNAAVAPRGAALRNAVSANAVPTSAMTRGGAPTKTVPFKVAPAHIAPHATAPVNAAPISSTQR